MSNRLIAHLAHIELLTPKKTIIDAMTYNQMFTLHGVVMVFLFIIPAVPAIFGNFVLPMQLGAKDVAFPRLNLLSYYCWVVGAIVLVQGVRQAQAERPFSSADMSVCCTRGVSGSQP